MSCTQRARFFIALLLLSTNLVFPCIAQQTFYIAIEDVGQIQSLKVKFGNRTIKATPDPRKMADIPLVIFLDAPSHVGESAKWLSAELEYAFRDPSFRPAAVLMAPGSPVSGPARHQIGPWSIARLGKEDDDAISMSTVRLRPSPASEAPRRSAIPPDSPSYSAMQWLSEYSRRQGGALRVVVIQSALDWLDFSTRRYTDDEHPHPLIWQRKRRSYDIGAGGLILFGYRRPSTPNPLFDTRFLLKRERENARFIKQGLGTPLGESIVGNPGKGLLELVQHSETYRLIQLHFDDVPKGPKLLRVSATGDRGTVTYKRYLAFGLSNRLQRDPAPMPALFSEPHQTLKIIPGCDGTTAKRGFRIASRRGPALIAARTRVEIVDLSGSSGSIDIQPVQQGDCLCLQSDELDFSQARKFELVVVDEAAVRGWWLRIQTK